MIVFPFRASLAFAAAFTLAGCNDKAGDPSAQYGANPKLPEPQQYLLPPMKVMPARGWKEGEMPIVPAGLRIQALATGFEHPRIVYTLPNGDVLVVEANGPKAPVYRPKDYIEGKVKGLAGSGAKGRQPHHAAPRPERRRRREGSQRVDRQSEFAIRRRSRR